MTQPDQPTAPQTPSVVQRLDAMHQQGYGYVDPAVQGMLASGNQSDQSILSAAAGIGEAIGSSAKSLVSSARTVFEDPVLYKQPTAALKVHQWLTQQSGWMPVAQVDLPAVQKQLQGMGYGKGLDMSGVWTSDWQEAFHQASQDHYEAMHASNEGQGFSIGHVVHSTLSSLMPSHAIPAIWGGIKALPGEVRHVAADAAGMTVNTADDLFHTFKNVVHGDVAGATRSAFDVTKDLGTGIVGYSASRPGGAAATIGGFLDGEAPKDYADAHGFHRAIENVNTLLLALPLLRLGGSVAEAGGQALAKGLFPLMEKGTVIRGPGAISNMLYRPAGHYATEGGADYVGSDAGLLSFKAFDHMPWLRQMMPAVRQGVADGQRYWYYTARPFAAAAYRVPAVAFAGHTLQQAMLTGALFRGDANAVAAIAGDNEFTKKVKAQAPYTGPVGMALDLLGAVAHGPLTSRTAFPARSAEEAATQKATTEPLIGVRPSVQFGDSVRAAHNIYDTMLGKPGVIGSWERGTGFKFEDELAAYEKAGLDQSDLFWDIQSKLDELSAGHAAGEAIRAANLRGDARELAFKTEAARIRGSDPEALSKARAELVDNHAGLSQRFFADSNSIRQGQKAGQGDRIAKAKVRRIAYELFNDPNLRWQNIHGGTFAALKSAVDDREFATAMGDKVAGPEPALTAAWLRLGNPEAPYASLGIARSDKLLRGPALEKISDFEKEYAKVAPKVTAGDVPIDAGVADRAGLAAVKRQMGEMLLELHVDPNSIPLEYDKMLAVLKERANGLAEKVVEPLNPTAEYAAKRQAVRDLGFELVHGTGIGFEFTNPIIDPVVVAGGLSTRRKFADAIGMSSTYASTMDAGPWARLHTVRAWQDLIDEGKITPQPGWTPAHLYSHVYENRSDRLTGARGGVFHSVGQKRYRKVAQHAAGPDGTAEEVQAHLDEFEKQLASERSLLDMTEPELIKAFTAKPRGGIPNDVSGELQSPVTEAEARILIDSMIGAVRKRPKFIFGGSHIEDLMRAGGAGFAGGKVANNRVLARAAHAGNDYVKFRNTYRFGIDPMFSMRRVVKSYLKLRTVGVPTSRHLPFEAMVQQGTLDADLKYADRLFPEMRYEQEGFDALDRAVHNADMIGVFNPRHFVAYGAGWLKRQGLADDEVKAQVEKALTYGERTGLERTIGTIFYPFSFEKTLYRQVGAKLLDEPGQRFMLAAAVQAFDALNHDGRLTDFATKHLPILHELNKLNAFSHGLGPGITGGINAPLAGALWNAMRPQHVQSASGGHAYSVLSAAVPVLGELNSLLVGYSPTQGLKPGGGTLVQQLGITRQQAYNWFDAGKRAVFNDPRSPWNPQTPAETVQAQQDDGYQLRNHLVTQWASAIDYNYHHRTGQITFPSDGSVPDYLAGKPVSKGTIDTIVNKYYPGYDPAAAQKIAVSKQLEMGRYLDRLTAANADRGAAYRGFADNAERYRSYQTRAALDPANIPDLANWSAQFRAYAISLSEQDPEFYKFYRTYFQSTFGPLEALTNG